MIMSECTPTNKHINSFYRWCCCCCGYWTLLRPLNRCREKITSLFLYRHELGIFFHLSQLQRVCTHVRERERECSFDVFLFSRLIGSFTESVFVSNRKCSFKTINIGVFRLLFNRFKAYTHELSVIDFVIAAPFFSGQSFHHHLLILLAVCCRRTFRWFTLIYSCFVENNTLQH